MPRVFLVLVLLLAGCSFGADGGGGVELGELSGVVLQPDDLPPAFVRFDEGRQVVADSPGGRRADPKRFGRRDGWKARYRRPGSRQTSGPLVVVSRADLFEDGGGAGDDLDAAREDLDEQEQDWQPIAEPGLGDESFAATLVQGSGAGGVRYYEVYWRQANVSALLSVNGFEGRVTLEEVLELARKQSSRISAAAES